MTEQPTTPIAVWADAPPAAVPFHMDVVGIDLIGKAYSHPKNVTLGLFVCLVPVVVQVAVPPQSNCQLLVPVLVFAWTKAALLTAAVLGYPQNQPGIRAEDLYSESCSGAELVSVVVAVVVVVAVAVGPPCHS